MVPAPYYSWWEKERAWYCRMHCLCICTIAVLATNYVVAKGHVQKWHIVDKWVLAMCCHLELPVRAILSPGTVQGYQPLGMIQ